MSAAHDDVVEVLEGSADARVLLTCEHASNRLPPPWTWPEGDRWLVDTHWAVDLGIADVTRDLARAIGAPAVLARFSRLLCDANRPLDAETLFRGVADGHPVSLNQALTDEERHLRIRRFHAPYHEVADGMLLRYPHAVVLSMHSFTPVYEAGPPRPMELAVLFDQEERISHAMAEALARDGWQVALNEPYSGKDGLIYSADRHAARHGRRALELEVRQDVATDPARRPRLIGSLRHALQHAGVL
ncbi:MAG: N-formylglutamate amidohydrolase [Myxococcota bacterium]